MRQKIWSLTQSLRLHSLCVLCNQFHDDKMAVCNSCIELMTPLGAACRYCAYPLADPHFLACGRCIKKPPSFDRAFINYIFEEPLRNLLHQFKYHNGLYLGSFLCQLMLLSLPNHENLPECLIPVPMHPQRIKARGFNQAAVLTRLLAKKLKLPFDLTKCQKVLNTKPQASLDGEQRKKNLREAFKTQKMPWKHVAIIDDLLTTGSTANEIACTLKKSGVAKVDVWCCARAVNK
ncbi:competence protein ComF [Legionella wadsworthii]|uniref:Competence protein ComF n=1 Tax=Legionella wadsworthii TaxID=28088 RepID=A0A378LRC6_9GAMM|nr:competence protein ComF [Legionella wadsworthii]